MATTKHLIPMNLRHRAFVTLFLIPSLAGPSLAGAALPGKVELKAKLDKSFEAAEQALAALPMEKLEPAALQKSLGIDPQLLRDWVTQNIRWVPYLGTLKGAQGTLLARAGNSLDRALLLAELLKSAGMDEVRIASLPLDQAGRDRLRPEAVKSFERVQMAAKEMKAQGPEGSKLLNQLNERLKNHPQRLAKLVPLTGKEVLAARWVEQGLQNHYRVEYQVDRETWKPLDLFLSSRPVAGAAGETEYFSADKVPKKLHHKVALKVVVHRESEGKQTRHTALQHQFSAAEHSLGQLQLTIAPINLPSDEEFAELAGRPKETEIFIRAAMEQVEEWVPVLTVGKGQPIVQKGFDYTGSLIRNPGALLAGSRENLGTALDQLSGLGGSKDAAKKKGRLARVSVEYQVSGPGVKTRTTRRVLFDREVSPQPLDRSCALNRVTRILLQTAALPREWAVRQQAEGLLSIRLASHYLLDSKDAKQSGERLKKSLTKIHTLPFDLVTLASAREMGAGYLAEVNLLSSWQSTRHREAKLTQTAAIDILHNRIASSRPQDGFQSGIRDSILESFIVDPSKGRSTSNRFQTATSPWQVIRDGDALRQIDSDSTELQAVLQEELRQGFHLLLEDGATGQRAIWWRINPESGETLGMVFGSSGVGGEALTNRQIIEFAIVWGTRAYLWENCVEDSGDALTCSLCSLFGVLTGSFVSEFGNISVLVTFPIGDGSSIGCNRMADALYDGLSN